MVTARRSVRGCLHPAWRWLPVTTIVLAASAVTARVGPDGSRHPAELVTQCSALLAPVLLGFVVVASLTRLARGRCLSYDRPRR